MNCVIKDIVITRLAVSWIMHYVTFTFLYQIDDHTINIVIPIVAGISGGICLALMLACCHYMRKKYNSSEKGECKSCVETIRDSGMNKLFALSRNVIH